MKLPKSLRPATPGNAALESSSVTISADTFAVAPYRESEPSGERRRVILAAPAGITALPVTGAEALAAELGEDTVLLGCLDGAAARQITLTAGRSSITLSDSGILLRCGGKSLSVTPSGVSQQ